MICFKEKLLKRRVPFETWPLCPGKKEKEEHKKGKLLFFSWLSFKIMQSSFSSEEGES